MKLTRIDRVDIGMLSPFQSKIVEGKYKESQKY